MIAKKCTLTDAELIEAIQNCVSKLCDTGGRAWALSVPVNFNRDPDILITELCRRYAALEARHNALREAIHKAMGRTVGCDKKQTDDQLIADVAYLKRLASDHFKTSLDCGNRVLAVEQQYDALREAVEWMFECQEFGIWANENYQGSYEWDRVVDNARADVDRLLLGES